MHIFPLYLLTEIEAEQTGGVHALSCSFSGHYSHAHCLSHLSFHCIKLNTDVPVKRSLQEATVGHISRLHDGFYLFRSL